MDKNSYKTYDIRKPKKIILKNEFIKVILLRDIIFLFPEKNIIDK
jgi:hypothetical protein